MSDTRNLVLISFSGETKNVAALPLRQSPALISSAAM